MSLPPQDAQRTDIVIIGSGVAGLAAAIEAASSNRRVHITVLEAAPTFGGASIISGGGCCIVDTPLQRAHGITSDNVKSALYDWFRMGGDTVDREWATKYLVNSRREVYDWAERLGVRWISLQQPEGNRVPRWHQPQGWGREVTRLLLAKARSVTGSAKVDMRTGATVRRLLLDESTGAVAGVEVLDSDVINGGSSYVIACRSVLVCTGGFSGNLAKIKSTAPHLQHLPVLLSGGSITSSGSGHNFLEAVQARFRCLDHIWVYPVGTPDPTDDTEARGLGVRGLKGDIWLTKEGRRFHNEQLKGGFSGARALLAQPSQTAWMIFHASEISNLELVNNPAYWPPPEDGSTLEGPKSFWEDSPYAWRCKTLAELATCTGLPSEAAETAINAFNRDIDAGLDKDSAHGRPLKDAIPLRGDIAAIQLFPMAQKTFGGVSTDLNCRVISTAGLPIRGLYAAGEVAGMAGGCINGKAAIEGTMFGPCLYSGRVAGKAAVKDLLVHDDRSVSHFDYSPRL